LLQMMDRVTKIKRPALLIEGEDIKETDVWQRAADHVRVVTAQQVVEGLANDPEVLWAKAVLRKGALVLSALLMGVILLNTQSQKGPEKSMDPGRTDKPVIAEDQELGSRSEEDQSEKRTQNDVPAQSRKGTEEDREVEAKGLSYISATGEVVEPTSVPEDLSTYLLEPGEKIVLASEGKEFTGGFVDSTWWLCLKLRLEGGSEFFYGYVERQSQLASEVAFWLRSKTADEVELTVEGILTKEAPPQQMIIRKAKIAAN
jgi:hypothetical protein